MRYWLFKSEPTTFGIDDLAVSPRQTTCWDGVRNYQARNFMRDDMRKGDLGFFYHSSCAEPGIVGTVKIVKNAYPDDTAFDASDKHHDPKSDPDNPRWLMVDLKLMKKFSRVVSINELREHSDGALKDMLILRKGNRLSITPISDREWKFISKLAEQ